MVLLVAREPQTQLWYLSTVSRLAPYFDRAVDDIWVKTEVVYGSWLVILIRKERMVDIMVFMKSS